MDNLFYTFLVAAGIALGTAVTKEIYRDKAIQSGAAQYSVVTGEFFWKEKVVCLSQK